VDRIEGEKRRYGVWISHRSKDHFTSVFGHFDPAQVGSIDSEIWRKVVDEFGVEYASNKWATPIDKEKQQELACCFTMQMTQKGYMKFHLKKGIGPQLFFEHFMGVFDFLSYEEKARILRELYLDNIKERVVEKVHLANTMGPKPTVDEDFKGAKLDISYATLMNGKTNIEVTIDYSDPESPEMEFKGEWGPTNRLRDVVVEGAKLLPTWDNISEWSRETRNTVIKNRSLLERNNRAVKNTGRLLHQGHKDMNHQLRTQSNQLITVLENQRQLQDKQECYFDGIEAHLTQQDDVLQMLPQLQKNDQIINKNLVTGLNAMSSSLKGISQEIVNQDQIIDQTVGQAKDDIIEAQREDTDLLMNEVQNQNQKLDTIQDKISQMSDRIDVLRDVFETQFEKARRQYKDNLLRVLDLVAKMPGRTAKEVIKKLKDDLDVSHTTMYKYFRKLQEKGLIDAHEVKNGTRGRPPKAYSITDKLKNLIKKITKN
jgi:DNA-binding MarR family transcriptional regulator